MDRNMIKEASVMEAEQIRCRPYRVLHVLDHSWPVLSGYSIRSQNLVRAQSRLGFQPRVVTSPLHQLDDGDAADTTVDGLPYLRTPVAGWFSRPAITGRWPILREAAVIRLLRRRILALVDSAGCDVIHAHSPVLCGLAACQAAKLRGLPFVYEVRSFWEDAAVAKKKNGPQALRYKASRRLETYLARRGDAVVGIANHILQDLEARGLDPAKLFYVCNGVDTDLFQPLQRDAELAASLGLGDEIVLGYIGSLSRYEGVSWLVRGIAELKRRGARCKLIILGGGEDAPAVASAIQEMGLQDCVRFVGKVAHDQVQRYYSVVDVLVYPRRSSRLTELVTPLKPLEAMALGKPLLASRIGGMQELVEQESTGLLFAPDDVDEFCSQALRLIQRPELRRALGTQAREKVRRERDWKILVRRYEAVYEYASARKHNGSGNQLRNQEQQPLRGTR